MKPLKNMDFRQKRLFKYPGFCYNLNMKTNRLSREQVNEMGHDELVEAYMASQKKVRAQEEEIDLLTEELNHVRAMMFGRKSEKHQDNTTEEQLRFEFNEAESLYVAEEPAEEVTVKEHTRKVKRAGKKEMDLSRLPKGSCDTFAFRRAAKRRIPERMESACGRGIYECQIRSCKICSCGTSHRSLLWQERGSHSQSRASNGTFQRQHSNTIATGRNHEWQIRQCYSSLQDGTGI